MKADAGKLYITGATSGIGEGLARLAVKKGWTVAGTGRRKKELARLRRELGTAFIPLPGDVARPAAVADFLKTDKKLGGFDRVVLNAGWGSSHKDFDPLATRRTIATNVSGFAALADAALSRFFERGRGHLVGVSSVAGIRGARYAPVYNGSKAFVDKYLEGMRHKVAHRGLDIAITNIRPGFVDTALANPKRAFWIAPVPVACSYIWKVIEKKRKHAYVTPRWRLLGWLQKSLPDFLFHRL